MELFIRIIDGQPFEHPIMDENFKQAFPKIDTANLPPEFARFERIEQPIIGVYQVYEGVTYEWVDGIVKDVHHVYNLTDAEKAEKIALAMAEPHPDGWVFDEERCGWFPIPLTTDTSGSEPNVIG
jgi:hypothetical protein